MTPEKKRRGKQQLSTKTVGLLTSVNEMNESAARAETQERKLRGTSNVADQYPWILEPALNRVKMPEKGPKLPEKAGMGAKGGGIKKGKISLFSSLIP